MTTDRPLLGIALMLGFCVLAPLGDGMAKILGASVPLLLVLLVRFGTQAVFLTPLALAGGRAWPRNRLLALVVLRTVLHILGIALMFLSLRFLPLADAVAIAFVMPFILLLLGRVFLQEEVGPRRLIACCVGFAGTLMVIQPSFAAVGAPALLPLGVAVVFALFLLVTRRVAREVDPIAMQAQSGWIAAGILLVVFVLAPAHPDIRLIWPSPGQQALLLALGVLGTVAHLLMTWSLRFAPASTLAPMQYLEIPVATLIGWVLFSDLPNGLAAVGIAVTIATGLYVIHREQVAQRTPRARVAPPAI